MPQFSSLAANSLPVRTTLSKYSFEKTRGTMTGEQAAVGSRFIQVSASRSNNLFHQAVELRSAESKSLGKYGQCFNTPRSECGKYNCGSKMVSFFPCRQRVICSCTSPSR